MPLVSMVIAAYERPREILSTIHSLLIQTCQDFEILVVHDGPGAAVRHSVSQITDPRLSFYETERRQQDWGNSSKEFGSHLARGKYIGHSNDDNYYAPPYLQALVDAMTQADADFAYCNMIHSHHNYAAFETYPVPGFIDGGGWLCKAEIVKATPWPEPKSDSYADGYYVEALVARSRAVVKVPAYLFVHN